MCSLRTVVPVYLLNHGRHHHLTHLLQVLLYWLFTSLLSLLFLPMSERQRLFSSYYCVYFGTFSDMAPNPTPCMWEQTALASWACNPTDPYPDWHGLFTLVTSTETFNAPLSLFFSLSLLLFPPPNTHYLSSIYLTFALIVFHYMSQFFPITWTHPSPICPHVHMISLFS